MNNLEKRVISLEKRNRKIELNKAWETSTMRRLLLVVLTYISIVYMWVIGINKPWLNAVIPSIGFLLSTLTVTFFQKMWIKNIR